MANIVWIVGAGFSKPLGGPLLGDLFKRDAVSWLAATFEILDGEITSCLHGAHRLYHYGCRFKDGPLDDWNHGKLRGELLWENAEQFIDFLETAEQGQKDSAARLILERIISLNLRQEFGATQAVNRAAAGARRLLAAECSAFLASADPRTERWSPYVNWARYLEPNDVVVTFNYDRVLELIADTVPDKFDFAVPGQKPEPKRVRVLHLHGCVDWELRSDNTIHRTDSPDFAISCADEQLAIYAPGPRKMLALKHLKNLWDEALKAISTAKAVVFIGYRFPPSDAESREKLLGAISRNNREHLAVHIVLGPNPGDRDVLRLEQLLRYAARIGRRMPTKSNAQNWFTLMPQRLWAEDFLSIVPNEMVLEP